MRAITYLVDGYNLLHRAYAELMRGASLEAAREALETRLRRFQRAGGEAMRVVLVWDGDRGEQRAARQRGFEVRYSPAESSADDVIVAYVRSFEARSEIRVVTDDWSDIGRHLRGLRARHTSCREFAEVVEASGEVKPRSTGAAQSEKPERLGRAEVDKWLDAFGFGVDDAEDRK